MRFPAMFRGTTIVERKVVRVPTAGAIGYREPDDTTRCRENVARVRELAAQLREVASRTREGCRHDGCRLLNGVIQDCSVRILNLAEWWGRELDAAHASERAQTAAPGFAGVGDVRALSGKVSKS